LTARQEKDERIGLKQHGMKEQGKEKPRQTQLSGFESDDFVGVTILANDVNLVVIGRDIGVPEKKGNPAKLVVRENLYVVRNEVIVGSLTF
jgi:hypothetical protein